MGNDGSVQSAEIHGRGRGLVGRFFVARTSLDVGRRTREWGEERVKQTRHEGNQRLSFGPQPFKPFSSLTC